MARIILVRLGWTVAILLGVSLIAFMLMRALPGDFVLAAAGTTSVSPEVLETMRRDLGLDRPLLEQYFAWLGSALQGDLGRSFVTRAPVMQEIWPRFVVTIQLTLVAAIMAMLIGVTTGLLSARLKGHFDWLVRVINGLSLAIPNFVVGTLIVLLAGLYFPQIAVFGYTPFLVDPVANIKSLILPGFALALAVSVTISENTRAAVLEVASQDFVMVARAKGLRRSTVLYNYLVRNALTPIITVTGLQVATLLGGSILVETIFAIPGMGQYLFDSITNRDYPVIQAIVLMAAAVVVFVNMLVDIAYARADARVAL
ncbi:peptide/nickel transport system permease protein [Devosia enhydra]|uniref:Peptide/nickel transport system permease protein n=1 Tax=Devosia enhydra TaxID=665118 RepID=A0A1K2I2S4_9HYPH|nr:ABC transporter permease [Devosia enhydra]SFZ86686.1 peptide/nickel transport system permease protein [Devosia enhydra]